MTWSNCGQAWGSHAPPLRGNACARTILSERDEDAGRQRVATVAAISRLGNEGDNHACVQSGHTSALEGSGDCPRIVKPVNRGEQPVVLLPLGLHQAVCVRLRMDEHAHGLSDATLDADRFERLAPRRHLRDCSRR
jgi:hypothetical protein